MTYKRLSLNVKYLIFENLKLRTRFTLGISEQRGLISVVEESWERKIRLLDKPERETIYSTHGHWSLDEIGKYFRRKRVSGEIYNQKIIPPLESSKIGTF